MTGSPSRNELDPDITPVIDLSRACFHLEMTGTPRGAEVDTGVETGGASDLSPPKLNRLIVDPRFALLTTAFASWKIRVVQYMKEEEER